MRPYRSLSFVAATLAITIVAMPHTANGASLRVGLTIVERCDSHNLTVVPATESKGTACVREPLYSVAVTDGIHTQGTRPPTGTYLPALALTAESSNYRLTTYTF